MRRVILQAFAIAVLVAAAWPARAYVGSAPSPAGGGGSGSFSSLNVSGLTTTGGISSTGPTSITGNQGTGSDFINQVCLNSICPITSFGANAEATAPSASITATISGTTAVALSAAGNFKNASGIALYGAGANCSINSTACGSITAPTPTVTWNGYQGSTNYSYEISACDAGWGCTAAGSAGSTSTGVAVLSEPNEGGSSGQYPGLAWTATTGASHYLIWRNKASSGYLLWAIVDTNSFNDYSNHQSINGGNSLTGFPYGNTPLAAVQNDVYVGTVVSGAGTTSLVVTPSTTQTGSTFPAWPDDTAAYNSCETAANTIGGECFFPAGHYKVRTLTPTAGVIDAGVGSTSVNTDGTIIHGTEGYDMFVAGNIGPHVWQNLAMVGGRNTFAPSGNWTGGFKFDWITTNPDYASLELGANSAEELHATDWYMNKGWYGIDQSGNAYLQKSWFAGVTTFNSQYVNGLHVTTNTQSWGYSTFQRIIVQGASQNGLYINAPIVDLSIDGYTDEGIGNDWTVLDNTTATCTGSNNTATVTSATNLAAGQWFTVVGCGSNGDLWQGYICAAYSSGTSVPICSDTAGTVAFNSSTAQAIAQYASNSPYDNFLFGVNGTSLTMSSLRDANFANTGGCCGGTQTRFQINQNTGAATLQNVTGKLYNSAMADYVVNGNNVTYYHSVITANGFPAGQFTLAGSGGPLAQQYSLLDSPAGGDFNIALDDSTSNQSGSIGTFRVRQSNSNRDTLFSVAGSSTSRDNASVGWRGSLQSLGQTAPTITAGCTGSGGSVVGSNNSFLLTTQTSGAATTCTITFAGGGFPAAPHCVFTDANASTTPVAYSAGATSATTVVVDFASATGAKIDGVCF